MLGVVKHCIVCLPKVYRRCSIYCSAMAIRIGAEGARMMLKRGNRGKLG